MTKNNLREVLDEQGLKQSDLKNRGGCHLSIATINRVASQKRVPSKASLVQMVNSLNRAIKAVGGEREYKVQEVFPSIEPESKNGSS
jgi:transcriptional regulator with XRE-family HTH domain